MTILVVLIKPDGCGDPDTVQDIKQQLEESGMRILDEKSIDGSPDLHDLFSHHYLEHKDKEFYQALVNEMAVGPVIVWKVDGDLDSAVSLKTAVRKKYAKSRRHNTIHTSDSLEGAAHEVGVWFGTSD